MNRITIFTVLCICLFISVAAQAQIVADGGVETGTPNKFWAESSTNFGSPICNTAQCGEFFGGPFEGQYWAWFGGATLLEIGSLSQQVTIPTGTATLSFYLEINASSGNETDFLTVSLDGKNLFTVFDTDQAEYDPWVEVIIDVTTFADGGSHLLSFDSTVTGPMRTNFYVDAISITVEAACEFDLDDDNNVSTSDLLALFAQWGTDGPADFDGDGTVGTSDLLILFANWGPCK